MVPGPGWRARKLECATCTVWSKRFATGAITSLADHSGSMNIAAILPILKVDAKKRWLIGKRRWQRRGAQSVFPLRLLEQNKQMEDGKKRRSPGRARWQNRRPHRHC